ncbi:MAG: hypothetical protein WBO55_01665 [Rhizobiaceae bacterium]
MGTSSFRLSIAIVFLSTIAFLSPVQASELKTVKAGQSTLIHEQSFIGTAPAGLRAARPYIVQPQHGAIVVRTSVSGSGVNKKTTWKFFYTSRGGYKGRDRTELGVRMQMRDTSGSVRDIIFPEAIKVGLVVW